MGRRTKTRERVVQRERTETQVEPVVEEEEVVVAVCDFCEQEYEDLDPDDLNTVLLNPSTPPRKFSDTVQIPMDDSFNRPREVYAALRECEPITMQRKRVMEAEPVMHEDPKKIPDLDTFDRDLSSDLIAYQFTFHAPVQQRAEAEIEVCDHCKEAFKK